MGQEAHFAYPSLSLYKGKKICHARARRVNEVGGHTLPNHLSLACAGSAIPWLRDAAAPRRTLRTTALRPILVHGAQVLAHCLEGHDQFVAVDPFAGNSLVVSVTENVLVPMPALIVL